MRHREIKFVAFTKRVTELQTCVTQTLENNPVATMENTRKTHWNSDLCSCLLCKAWAPVFANFHLFPSPGIWFWLHSVQSVAIGPEIQPFSLLLVFLSPLHLEGSNLNISLCTGQPELRLTSSLSPFLEHSSPSQTPGIQFDQQERGTCKEE